MKGKIFVLATILLGSCLVGCGEVEPCETHTFVLKQDGDNHFNECSVCGFKEEGVAHVWKKDTSKTDVPATCAAAGVAYKVCACGATKEEPVEKTTNHTFVNSANQAGLQGATCTAGDQVRQECSVCHEEKIISSGEGLGHNYVDGSTVKNSDGKDCLNKECSRCHVPSVAIALTDCDNPSNIESSGKIKKGASLVWKIVCPKAGNVTLQFFINYGQSGNKLTDDVRETIWGKSDSGQNPYIVKNGETEATVLVNEKAYNETGMVDEGAYIDFAKFAVTQGENTITFTTPTDQYYRNSFSGNVVLVYDN